jgi:hypothetical protein
MSQSDAADLFGDGLEIRDQSAFKFDQLAGQHKH